MVGHTRHVNDALFSTGPRWSTGAPVLIGEGRPTSSFLVKAAAAAGLTAVVFL